MKELGFVVLVSAGCVAPPPAGAHDLREQLAAQERPASVPSDPAFAAWKTDPESRTEALRSVALTVTPASSASGVWRVRVSIPMQTAN